MRKVGYGYGDILFFDAKHKCCKESFKCLLAVCITSRGKSNIIGSAFVARYDIVLLMLHVRFILFSYSVHVSK